MAIVHFVKNRRTQTVGGLHGVLNYCCKAAKVDYEGRPLVSGVNCVPQAVLQRKEITMNTKANIRGKYRKQQRRRMEDFIWY